MKKRYLLIGSLALIQFFNKVRAQEKDDSLKLKKSDIELVYHHYIQEGDNSAVTGGVGTEELYVWGPSVTYGKELKDGTLSLNLGIDVITSPSTDRIDNVPSSHSIRDIRYYGGANYETEVSEGLFLSGGGALSFESDYTSLSPKIGFRKVDKNELSSFSGSFQYFDDDLRWGLLNADEDDPRRLIYPIELSTTEWFDTHKRYSYNLKLGYERIINQRNIVGLYPEVSYQRGILSTPFHRVYLQDGTVTIENLPQKRLKTSLGLKWNTFIGGGLILKNSVNYYRDDFGLASLALSNEMVIKIDPVWSLMPTFRYYTQQASDFFAPFQAHPVDAEFRTSDFDLSKFDSWNFGIGFKYAPGSFVNDRLLLNALIFRYSYFNRSNGLSAHSFSLAFDTQFFSKKEK